jgi:hypothetical protein
MNKFVSHSSAIALVALAGSCARHSGDVASLGTTSVVPIFETRIEIDSGTEVHSDYHVADIDNDGDLDMVIVSLTGELRVMTGDNGVFSVSQELEIGGQPIWMTGGDFNGDTFEDLVVVRREAGLTNVYLNDGSGGFALPSLANPEISISSGGQALAVTVGDLNGDSNLDVIVSRRGMPEILIAYGNGADGFLGETDMAIPGGGVAFNVAIGKVDSDELDDLVVTDPDLSRLVIIPGSTGLGGSSVQPICEMSVPGRPNAVSFGDLSGDGRDDMVVSAFEDDRYVVITDVIIPPGTGQPQPLVCTYDSFDVLVPSAPSLSAVGDVTGDGINDLVACLGFTASMCVAPGLAGGGVGEQIMLDATGMPLRPFIGDVDGNGKQDICALSGLGSRVNVWLSDDIGRLNGARSYASGLVAASWVEGADFDGDGDYEIITSSRAETNLSILGGQGALAIEGNINLGYDVYQLEAGDLDLDGKPDLVVGVAGGIKILHNTSTPGNYSFDVLPVSPVLIGSSIFPFGIEIGDFDRDADMDIAVCDYLGGGVHLILGSETAFTFEPEVVFGVGGGPIDIVAADFTGDGLLDFAVTRSDFADIAILRNDGGNQYVESLAVPVGDSPNYLVTEDFNADGRADLVVSNADSGTISVLFGTTNGFAGSDYAAGSSPTALMAKDMTGDGLVDILVASLASGDFRILVGDGAGSFPQLPTFPGTLGASDVVMQDMTGDGKPDLVASSLITDRISFVRNITPDNNQL